MTHAAAAHSAHDDTHGHPPTSTGLDNKKIAIWAFIGSECMLFISLISTYLIYKGRSVVGPYPHEACLPPVCATPLKPILNIPITSMSTFVLLMSSLAMVLALAAIQRGDHRRFRLWTLATALFGATFIAGQVFEFTEFYREGLHLDTNLFGSTFYVLTGFHGAHVTLGILWLLSLWGMSMQGRLPTKKAESVEIAGLYWHFVDVVWIVIFTVIYLIPQS